MIRLQDSDGTLLASAPQGGSILEVSWATDRDKSRVWYPTLEEALEALRALATEAGQELEPKEWYLDLTRPGCALSWAAVVPGPPWVSDAERLLRCEWCARETEAGDLIMVAACSGRSLGFSESCYVHGDGGNKDVDDCPSMNGAIDVCPACRKSLDLSYTFEVRHEPWGALAEMLDHGWKEDDIVRVWSENGVWYSNLPDEDFAPPTSYFQLIGLADAEADGAE